MDFGSCDINCSFCNEFDSIVHNNYYELYLKEYFTKYNLTNRIVFQNDNFVIMPMVGPLVKEYLLLLPRKHYLSYSHMPKELLDEASYFIAKIKELFVEKYNIRSVVYEHGAMSHKLKGGCCSDHAHMHIVGIECDVTYEIESYGYITKPIQSINNLTIQKELNKPYLFYENNNGDKSMFDAPIAEGQFIRKLLAKKINAVDRFLWNSNPKFEWMVEIIQDMNGLFK